ncbi:hypothetical protein EDB83DRAFT_2314657 [Lactarius deliciosus]|nr:hypothetical protein EDB83DRAFT_2314657 [Lactarius deliciosus]
MHPESPKNQKGPRSQQNQARWLQIHLRTLKAVMKWALIVVAQSSKRHKGTWQKVENVHRCCVTLASLRGPKEDKRRQKKALKDLQAKGFQMLPDFFRKKAKESEANTKFEAKVAAAKAKIKALQNREEEEDSEAETKTADKCNSELVSEPDKCAKEITRDPSLGHPWVAESGGTADGIKGEHTAKITDPRDLDTCLNSELPQYTVIEVEEDSDNSDKTGSNPSEGEQDSCKDAQAIVVWMLKDHHGNVPDVSGHLHLGLNTSAGTYKYLWVCSVLNILQDHVVLHKAKVELVVILKKKGSLTQWAGADLSLCVRQS